MKAVVLRAHGDASVLEVAEVPEPKIGARDVLIAVKAVALNHLDVWVRKGWPGLKLELPHILGSDIGRRRAGGSESPYPGGSDGSAPVPPSGTRQPPASVVSGG